MERQEIEAFLALCEELHFGRTAKRLRVSPARVTQLIQKVERLVGAPLFERTSRGVVLTELGRQFRQDLGPAHDAVQEAVRRAVGSGRGIGGELRLGFLGTENGRHLVALGREFEARHEDATTRLLLESEIGDHLRPLREHRVDLVATLMPVDDPELVVGPVVMREPLLMAMPENHPLAARDQTRIEDLADHAVIVSSAQEDTWIDFFVPRRTPSGREIVRTHLVDTLQAGMALIVNGAAIGPIITQFAKYNQHPGITYRPLVDAPTVESALVWTAAKENSAIRAFARIAEERGPVDLEWDPLAAQPPRAS
ncbi:LysR substrate-binding domain-containing protein [Glycomyces sp. NPDC048151]|uniref:LysR substrate-binding domain-containing protein n=1 Tax=Glycomyces sp. NPDC048151 TaxID=3364002 RepID=UPI003720B0A6